MKNPHPKQIEFAEEFFNLVTTDIDTNKITVIPAQCGIGKSTALRAFISFCAQLDDGASRRAASVGLVIITDELERLGRYKDRADGTKPMWADLGKYCTLISSNQELTPLEQLIRSRFRPVVLLSTQRYHAMPDDQREMLFSFVYNGQTIPRQIVIFDEKPYFFGVRDITIKNFNDFASGLQNGIPSNVTQDKDWALDQYWTFRSRMERLFQTREKSSRSIDRFYWRDVESTNITENDTRFTKILEKHKQSILSEYPAALNDWQDFQSLMRDGAFFVTQKKSRNQDYKTYFQLFSDNRSHFYLGDNKAKLFVLDATADIDPDYRADYIKMTDCSKYNNTIDLTINLNNVNTSKSKLINQNNAQPLISTIKRIIKRQTCNQQEPYLLATYQSIKSEFNETDNVLLGHFGALKGSNDYRHLRCLVYVGLNRYADFAYLTKYLYLNPNELDKLRNMTEDESRRYILDLTEQTAGQFTNEKMNGIMHRSLLSDFEQNIYRCAIRNFNNEHSVTAWCFWSRDIYAPLNCMINKRLKLRGAKIYDLGTPLEIEKLKIKMRQLSNGGKTNPQKVIDWYQAQPKGRWFTVEVLLEEAFLSREQYKTARKNKSIKDLLNNCRCGHNIFIVA